MADLITATKKWYQIVLVAREFPYAYSTLEKIFTGAGRKQFFAERRFIREKKSQINTVTLALCSHQFVGFSSNQTAENAVQWIEKAMEMDPQFFREYGTDYSVRSALEFLEKNSGLKSTDAAGSGPEQYFEVPIPSFAVCSDNQCPCPETAIPSGEGYLYISQDVVDNRKNARSRFEMERLAEKIKSEYEKKTGAMVMMDFKDILIPVLMCRQGAELRGLDMQVASADAKHWWKTGKIPLRATPLAGKK